MWVIASHYLSLPCYEGGTSEPSFAHGHTGTVLEWLSQSEHMDNYMVMG